MDPSAAYERKDSVVFLDVREPYEYEAGHIEDSLHIPIGQIAARVAEVPAEATLVVVCQVGQRSALVADFLTGQGIEAHNLEGGLLAWTAHGLPLSGSRGVGDVADGWARDLSGRRITWEPDRP